MVQVAGCSGIGQGVALSTSAVTPFRSFVQTPIFSVSPSSFSLQRILINIIIIGETAQRCTKRSKTLLLRQVHRCRPVSAGISTLLQLSHQCLPLFLLPLASDALCVL